MPTPLSGRTAFVTGAASGIGRACALRLHQEGARVVTCDLREDDVAALARELGGSRVLPLVADVRDQRSLDAAVRATVEAFGSIDVVLANAGIAVDPPATLATMAEGDFERVVDVDLLGVWRTVRATLPHLVEARGHILMTASIYAYVNGMVNAPYAASKAGVEQLSRALGAELAGTGTTSGVLYPGWVTTPISRSALDEGGTAGRLVRRAFPAPLRRPISPERVAAAAVRGIERRSPEVHVPRRWRPVSVLRGVVSPLVAGRLRRDPQVRHLLAQLEAERR